MPDLTPGQGPPEKVLPTQDPAYRVHLEVFEGPLDLLLYLIEKQELDITEVSLAAVTDQYLDYISHAEHISAENLASFLVVAAKLLLIKSRALLPTPPTEEMEEEDVGEALALQLREYRRFKELARQLGALDEGGLRAYLRLAAAPRLDKALDLTDVTLDELLNAVQEALSLRPEVSPVGEVVAPLAFTIGDKTRAIEELLVSRGSFGFLGLLREAQSRAEVIVTFLALLELIRAHRISVQQERLFGEILVSRPKQPAATQTPDQPEQ